MFFPLFTSHPIIVLTSTSPLHSRGDIALLRNADLHDRASHWSLERLWTGHHKGVVRSALLDERVSPIQPLICSNARFMMFMILG